MREEAFAPLRSPRLVLRRFERRDTEALRSYRSDPEVARYQAWESCTVADAERFVASMEGLEPGTPGTWFQFAVSEEPAGPLLGDCALRCTRSDPRQAELGFTFAREHQRQGLASEAVRRLLDYAFETLALHRVFAVVDGRNAPAQRLLARVGFREEGSFRENTWLKGAWSSERLYALLQGEWAAARRDAGAAHDARQGAEAASAIRVRLLELADLETFLALRREALETAPSAFLADPSDDLALDPDFVRARLIDPRENAILGAFTGELLVGVVGLYREPRRKADHKAHLWGLFVRAAHRGGGAGGALVSAAIVFARGLPGVTQIHLGVSEEADAALRLYARHGFVTWGIEPTALRVDGRPVPERHMTLTLS